MKKKIIIPIILLLAFLIIGLCIYGDFSASEDEGNQIYAGHVIWKYLCQKTGREVPEPIKDVSELYTYYNRYYGQAATFPTVLLEALRGFTLDSSTVLRIRHLWNFLCFFAGLCCLTALLSQLYQDPLKSSLGLLFMILLPRIFGDIFYNDRDTMVLAWMMISLFAFYRYLQRPGWFNALVCGFLFAVTYNTRMFGLLLLIFPFIFLFSSKHKKFDLLLVFSSFVFWILVSPIYWEDPLHSIPASFTHLTTVQRYMETLNLRTVMFFGKAINETQLPWYYLPVYIFVTTPPVTSLFAIFGCFIFIKKLFSGKQDTPTCFGIGMLIILFPFMLAVIIFRPTLYNGWRHFYFLYLPIIWMTLEGVDFLLQRKSRPLRAGSMLLTGASFLCSISWIISVHPYQDTYLNPLFRKYRTGAFTRDFWNLSSRECMQYLLDHEESIAINVSDNYRIRNTMISLLPAERDRFHTSPYMTQPNPIKYVYFNYDNETGNDKTFSYYAPVFAVERDGMKLAEVFQRTHDRELGSSEVVKGISADHGAESAALLTDGNYDTFWENTGQETVLTLELNENFIISDMEIFPLHDYPEFPDFRLYTSEDGSEWSELSCESKGWNGLSFPAVTSPYLQIQTSENCPGIRDILFYGIHQ